MLYLILIQLKAFRNRFLSLTFLGEIKVAGLCLIALIFLSWIYLAAWRLLSYLNSIQMIGPLLVNKLVALVFLTSFSMIAFSSIITSINTIFNSRDLNWLMATPLSIRKVFTFKALATSFYSSWMVLVAIIPFLLALGQVKNAGPGFYLSVITLLIPFLILASLLGVLISLFLMRFFPSRGTRDILLFLSVVFIAGLYILFRFMEPERLVRPDGLAIVAQYLAFLDTPTAIWLPSWWLAASIYCVLSGNLPDLIFYTSLLFGSASLLLVILIALARSFYFTGWAQGQVYARNKSRRKNSYARSSPFGALLRKDVTIFFRDAGQWSQILILSSIVVVYLFSIYKIPLDTMYLQNLLAFFNIGLIGFILSAVALRFVFPSLSLEGESVWLLFSAPFSYKKLFWEKLVFGGFPVVILGAVLIVMSNYFLKADAEIFWISSAAVIIISIGLCALAIGFGSAFPRFDLTNIAQIEASAGGLFFMVTALFYIVLNIALWSIPVQSFYKQKFSSTHLPAEYLIWTAAGLTALNLIFITLPIYLGLKTLKKIEV